MQQDQGWVIYVASYILLVYCSVRWLNANASLTGSRAPNMSSMVFLLLE
jgi:hypothetical protein